jgi:glutaredoxin
MKFSVYSKSDCPYCEKIKKVMSLKNYNHIVYELDKDFTREDFILEFGYHATFPQIILDQNKKIGGCVDTIRFLQEKNML